MEALRRFLEGGVRIFAGGVLIATTPVAVVADVISAPFRGEISAPATTAIFTEGVNQLQRGGRQLVGGQPAPAGGG